MLKKFAGIYFGNFAFAGAKRILRGLIDSQSAINSNNPIQFNVDFPKDRDTILYLRGAMGKLGDVEKPGKTLKGVWGYSAGKIETTFFRFA